MGGSALQGNLGDVPISVGNWSRAAEGSENVEFAEERLLRAETPNMRQTSWIRNVFTVAARPDI